MAPNATRAEPFSDATPLLDDPSALADAVKADGCLVFRSLLDESELDRVCRDVVDVLEACEWAVQDSASGGLRSRKALQEGSAGWWAGYAKLQSLESFHRLAHRFRSTDPASAIGGRDAFVHPRRVLAVTHPGFVTPSHQDFSYVQGTPDFFSAWIPLASPAAAPLRILRAPPRAELRPLHVTRTNGVATDVADDDVRWVTVPLERGDVAVYHALTVHAVSANSSDRVAFACDFRFQSASEPVCLASLKPHHYPRLPDWDVLTRGWSSPRWIEFPPGVPVVDFVVPHSIEQWHEEVPVPASRFA